MKAVEVLRRLQEGQARFLKGEKGPDFSVKDCAALAESQNPVAVVITCSDSRVVPEVIFSAIPGELFSVRVAGNGISEPVLGSVVYAVRELRCPLVVVMGHTRCGAIGAAVDGVVTGTVGVLTKPIIETAGDEEDVERVCLLHVREEAKRLREVLEEKGLAARVVTALYELETGAVTWHV